VLVNDNTEECGI